MALVNQRNDAFRHGFIVPQRMVLGGLGVNLTVLYGHRFERGEAQQGFKTFFAAIA